MVHGVAIVTGFVALRLGVISPSSNSVTAASEKATIGASVCGNPVAIIALLVGLNFRVAAFTGDVANDDLLAGACDEGEGQNKEVFVHNL